MTLSLADLWRRLRAGASAPTPVEVHETVSRLGEADTTDWMGSSRPAPPFSLDACFDAPAYVPGWMMPEGTRTSQPVAPVQLASDFGQVRADAAIGQEAILAEHYRRILLAAPSWRDCRAAHCGFFEVDLVIGIEGEHPLRLEMFHGAACGTGELLALLADADAPPDTLYDNLDQGWALRMVSTADAVFTLEWDWERPADEDSPRALRFPRRELAAQAVEALTRLRYVHEALVRNLGDDLWNQPPPPPKGRRRTR
jgi:hypothetical protein